MFTGNAYDVFVQSIGLISLICSLLSFQQKKRSQCMLLQMAASLTISAQLFLLGAVTGACLDFISFIRTLLFSCRDKYKWANSPFWLVFFLALMIVVGILTWDNIYSLMVILCTCLSTVALWMKEGRHIRRISLLVGPCGFVYCLANGSYTGALNEVIAVASILIGIIRLDMKHPHTVKKKALG